MSELQATKNKVSYELYMLMSPITGEEDLGKLKDNIVKILEDKQAHVQKVSQFVRSELAYPINKDRSAYVSTMKFVADPEVIEEIKRLIDLLDIKPMRYLVTKEEKRKEEKRRRVKPTTESLVQEKLTDNKEKVSDKKLEETQGEARVSDSTDTSKEAKTQEQESLESEKEEKVTLDDIDKKLDEIMGNL